MKTKIFFLCIAFLHAPYILNSGRGGGNKPSSSASCWEKCRTMIGLSNVNVSEQKTLRIASRLYNHCNNLELIKHLVEAKADVHLTGYDGKTALSNKSPDIIKYLVSVNVDVNKINDHEKTALGELFKHQNFLTYTDIPWFGKEPKPHKPSETYKEIICTLLSCKANWHVGNPTAATTLAKIIKDLKQLEMSGNMHRDPDLVEDLKIDYDPDTLLFLHELITMAEATAITNGTPANKQFRK